MKKYIFFRNDDVRAELDESLVKLTDLFLKYEVPISHAVEPANVSSEVINWLMEKKFKHPDLIEIVQHGYCHDVNFNFKKNNKTLKGEFGGNRDYSEQIEEVQKGKQIMFDKFGENWFELFTFPFGSRNREAVKAVSDAGFKCINGSVNFSFKWRLFHLIGRLLRKITFLDRNVSYHLKKVPNTKLYQIDVSVSPIKKYINSETKCDFYELDEILNKVEGGLKVNSTIGVILHHRYHNTAQKIDLIKSLLERLKENNNVVFSNQEAIFKKLSNG